MDGNIISFLQGLKTAVSYQKPVTVVMGNEAADLDSLVSSLTYSWYLHLNSPAETTIPFVHIPRSDFKLRAEAVFLFAEAGVSSDLLLFAEDVDLEKLYSDGNLNLVLVDHNRLASGQAGMIDAVTEILDHHTDEKYYPSGIPAVIKPVGSTATIVTEQFLRNQRGALDESIGTLLLGTILLDTVDLDPEAGRVTADDTAVAEALITISGLEREMLFGRLQFEKFKVSSLCSYDLLRKDYKEWQFGSVKCGVGSVSQSIEEWIEKDPGIAAACDTYRKERELDVLLVMNTFNSPDFTRQMVVSVPDEHLRTNLISFLESSDFGLSTIETISRTSCCSFYDQKNTGISRKRLQPILKSFFEKSLNY